MASAEYDAVQVEVIVILAMGRVQQTALRLPVGASVGDALRLSGLCPTACEGDAAVLKVGVWGQLKPLDHPLRDRDRVEVYRPLLIDPKEARRRRQRTTCNRKRLRP